jgi:hypothetical protein
LVGFADELNPKSDRTISREAVQLIRQRPPVGEWKGPWAIRFRLISRRDDDDTFMPIYVPYPGFSITIVVSAPPSYRKSTKYSFFLTDWSTYTFHEVS